MKVVILAFDGLEAEIVQKEKLKSLLQNYHGTIDVSYFKVATPMIWSSFLTGKPPEEHKMYFFTTTGNRFIEGIRRTLFEHNVKYYTIRRIGKLFEPFLKLMGIKRRVPRREDLKLPTFFDLAKNPLPINVIMYNEWKESEELKFKYSIVNAVGNPILTKKVINEWRKIFLKQKEIVLKRLNDNWDLLMTHVYLTDVAGHLYYNRYRKLVQIYKEMDKFAGEVKKRLDDSAFILIVSDHGMKRGMHVPRSFYSTNIKPVFTPKKITDFYKMIERTLAL